MDISTTTPLISIPGIAEELGVGEGRARQLITQPDFPKPAFSLSPKNRVWWRERVREWAQGKRESSRVAADTLPIVSSPLPRVFDELVSVEVDGYPWHGTVYLRVFQGDGYAISILDRVEGDIPLQPFLENIYRSLITQLPHLLGGTVCWIEVQPHSLNQLANVVVTTLPDGTVTDPAWIPFTHEQLTERVGSQVEMYHAGRATPENIQAFLRLQKPIENAVNDDRIRHFVDTIHILESGSLPEESRRLALDITATTLLSIDDMAKISDRHPLAMERLSPTILWAVRDYERVLSDDELALAQKHARLDGPGWTEHDALTVATVNRLLSWRDTVDEFSERPDRRVYDRLGGPAVTLAMQVQDPESRAALENEISYRPELQVMLFRGEHPHVRNYLGDAKFAPLPPDRWTRAHRILASKVSATAEFSRDRFGNLIALSPTSGTLGVFWPRKLVQTRAQSVLLDGTRDTIAYLLDAAGTQMDLLPRLKTPQSTGWASGYGGTGSGDLISAIANYADAAGTPVPGETLRRIISDPNIPEQTVIPLT